MLTPDVHLQELTIGLGMTLSGLFGLILTPLGESPRLFVPKPVSTSAWPVLLGYIPPWLPRRTCTQRLLFGINHTDTPDILVKGPLNGSYTALNIVLFIMGFIASMTLYGRTKYTPKIGLPTSAQVNEHSILEEDEDGN